MNLERHQYDVFISYNTRDHSTVERVARWLKQQGLKCFVDRWYLTPGVSWPRALEEALEKSKAVAIFVGPGPMGRWQEREHYRALDLQTTRQLPVIPVLLPGSDPALGFLSLNTWVDLRTSDTNEHQLSILAGAILGKAPAELTSQTGTARNTVCPFRGLLAFREEDAAFFFGRRQCAQEVFEAVSKLPFAMVVGASGSGKSSVVRAGVVPRLREADSKTVWELVTMEPTDHPLHSLIIAFSPVLWPNIQDKVELREKANQNVLGLERGTLSVRDLVELVLDQQPGTNRLFLLVDQWEELYTLCPAVKTRHLFIDQLLEAVQRTPLTVVATCRGDFYGRVAEYRPLVDRIRRGLFTLGPMDRAELAEVIEKPAEKVGLQLEPGLQEKILDDVDKAPGALPLLSFLLEQLWQQRRAGYLTFEAYEAIGGVQGAIAHKAEAVFKKLSDKEKELLPRIFIQLVSVGEDSEVTKRRASLRTLGGEQARPIIDELADARLLVTSSVEASVDVTVEVAHEALIRTWQQSQGWVNNARGFLIWRKRLEPFMHEWQTLKRDSAGLLRGGLLDEARRWLKDRPQDLDDPEREFIEASAEQRRREQKAEARRIRWLTGISIAASIACAIAVIAAIIAIRLSELADRRLVEMTVEKQRADENAKLALQGERESQGNFSSSLVAQSETLQNTRPRRSMLFAVEAINVTVRNKIPVVRAEQRLRDLLLINGGVPLAGHTGWVESIAFSPDNRWLVTGSRDRTARLWNLTTAKPEKSAHVLNEHDATVDNLAISPDSRWLVTSGGPTARLWDLTASVPEQTVRVLRGHSAYITTIEISPDGRWLVTISNSDDVARLWDLTAKEPERTGRVLSSQDANVYAAAISPDGRWLVTGCSDNAARVCDLTAVEPENTVRVLSGHEAYVGAVAISPDSRWLITGSADDTARLWELSTSEPERTVRVLRGHKNTVNRLAVSSSSRWLVTASFADDTARLYDLTVKEPGQSVRVLSAQGGGMSAIAFSPDNRWLVAHCKDESAWLWDLAVDNPQQTGRVLQVNVKTVGTSRDGRWLVAVMENTARLWDLSAEDPAATMRVWSGHDSWVTSVAISPNNRWLVTGSLDHTARLWDLTTARPETTVGVWNGHESSVSVVVTSPNNRWLVAGGTDVTWLWDLNAAQPEKSARALSGHEGKISAAAISSNSRWLVARGEKTIGLWDLTTVAPEKAARLITGHEDSISAIAISPDGRWLVAGADNVARLYEVTATSPETNVRVLSGHEGSISAVAISSDNRWLVTGTEDKTAWLWDLTAKEPERTGRVLSGHDDSVNSLMISTDNRWLITGSRGMIRLWDLTATSPEKTSRLLSRKNWIVISMAISPDSRWLAIGGYQIAWLLDLTAAAPEQSARVLIGHGIESVITSVAFSPKSRWLVTGGNDRTARLWDLTAPAPEKTARLLSGPRDSVKAVCISPEERWVVAVSSDGTIWFHELQLDKLIMQAKRAVGRNFTPDEWNAIYPDKPFNAIAPFGEKL